MLAWRGRFDPEAFSIKAANAALAKLHRAPRARKASAAGAARHTQDLTKLMRLAAVEGRLTARIAKTRVAPGTALPLELTGQERELILNNSFAPYELTRRLRIVPQRGKPAVVRYNLEELDELAGYVASESNHTDDRKLHRQWQEIYDKIAAILDAYTDDEA
jgi:hypothetical protein